MRNGVYSGYHLIGSNRMSLDATSGVVGPDFAVHGLSGLSVCDASVLPDHLSSHSYLSVIAMARMFGDIRGWT
jgi:choline dehydrogenase